MASIFENIHIAILGPVSAGKSTFLNALFSNTFSDMKRKKTTMLPQIYKTTMNEAIIDNQEQIYEKNRLSNDHILKLREENKYSQTDFTELVYNVKCIDDFIKLSDKTATYSILDMPGLNCGGGDNMYFNYISQISKNIDIYLLVFDINSGLNTTDEVNILSVIANEIKKNNYGYVHIIINKCDDVVYNNNSIKFNDDELQELYDRCVDTANKYFKDIKHICNISISPLCASDLYVFRSIKNNIDSIDEKHLDKIIMNECGKKELNKLSSLSNKQKYIQGLIKQKQSTLYDDWMKDTGYNLFKSSLSDITSNYTKIVEYHITMELNNILSTNITNLDVITDSLEIINYRLLKLSQVNKKYNKSELIVEIINNIMVKINNYINNGIDGYSASTIEKADTFIDKISKFADKIKNWFSGSNPLAQSKDKLVNKRYLLLNDLLLNKYNEKIFDELYNNNKVDIEKFKNSIDITLNVSENEQCMPDIIIKLLKSICVITKNNNIYISIIMDAHFNTIITKRTQYYEEKMSGYQLVDNDKYYKSMEELIILVANTTNKDTKYIFELLKIYYYIDSEYKLINIDIYKYWLDSHKSIFNCCREINYIYYIFDRELSKCINNNYYINGNSKYIKLINNNKTSTDELIDCAFFNNIYERMDNIFKILTDIYITSFALDAQTLCGKSKEPINKEPTSEEYTSADEEMSEDYSDNDDAKIVYEKASRNASIRLNKTIKLGSISKKS
jgi:predicted GTPase